MSTPIRRGRPPTPQVGSRAAELENQAAPRPAGEKPTSADGWDGSTAGAADSPSPPPTPSATTPGPAEAPGLRYHALQQAAAAPLPAWFPPGLDLQGVAQGARSILEAQGQSPRSFGPGWVENVVFTDADHTLIKTTTPVLLRDTQSGALLRHPGTGRLVLLPSRDYRQAFEDLQKEFPGENWGRAEFDYRGMASVTELRKTPAIRSSMNMLREHNELPRGREFIITARSADNIPAGFEDYLSQRGVDLDGVFPVNAVEIMKALDLDPGLDTAHKKAITMAGLIALYEMKGPAKDGSPRTVKFYEDSDPNLRAAMTLLPKLYPELRFEFFDVVHTGDHRFQHHLVAESKGGGDATLRDSRGRALSDAELERYESEDAPERRRTHAPIEDPPPGSR